MDLSRFDARDLGYAADAIKPFEDLTAHELARRVRIERALALGNALAALGQWIARLLPRLRVVLRDARASWRLSASRAP
jgi:hypothetical protein